MSTYEQVHEYRAERKRLSRPAFLALYSTPVMLTPKRDGATGPGYFTRPKTAALPKASYALKLGFLADDSYLVLQVKKAEGRPFPERIGVGRTRGTDIILTSTDISKYHAYFTTDADNWWLTDAGSSNGTFVNGERIPPMTSILIEDCALLAFGSCLCIFRTAVGFCDFIESFD